MSIKDMIQKRGGERLPARRAEDRSLFSLQRDINELFSDFFGDFGLVPFGRPAFGEAAFMPAVDVTETEKEVRVSSELPGMDEKDVKLELDDYGLTISGEKKEEHEEKGPHGYRCERSYGTFRRLIPLPAKVDSAKARAEFRKGVLTVTLPKVEQDRKKVQIKIE